MTKTAFPWHRVFHPLCGADPGTLAGLVLRRGPPSLAGAPAFAVAVASALARLPFTALERALDTLPRATIAAPVFIVGHPRSGTTHLHNLMAASGAFATVPPVLAALPWERRTLGPLLRPFINPYLPATRLIDGVALGPDAPTEDEVGLANLGPHSYFHAIYFPRAFAEDYRRWLIGDDARRAAPRARAIRRYVTAMARSSALPLLLKNPAYTAQISTLLRLFPGARVVHIRRDPHAVFASTRRALRRALAELSLQGWDQVDIDAVVLETYPAMMRIFRAQVLDLPPQTIAEVAFEDLVAAPEAVLNNLWDRLDLPGDADAIRGMAAYLATVRGYRPAPSRVDDAERALLRGRWPEEFALYGVKPARPPPACHEGGRAKTADPLQQQREARDLVDFADKMHVRGPPGKPHQSTTVWPLGQLRDSLDLEVHLPAALELQREQPGDQVGIVQRPAIAAVARHVEALEALKKMPT